MQFSDWSNITDYGLLFHSASVLSGGLRLTDQDAENNYVNLLVHLQERISV